MVPRAPRPCVVDHLDFAHSNVEFDDVPGQRRLIWLFSILRGHSHYLWDRLVEHQDLQTVLRCHMEAFGHPGGVPREILCDRMKTAVLGEAEKHIVYNAKLVAFAQHLRFCTAFLQGISRQDKGLNSYCTSCAT
jgi:transposase